VSAWTSPCTGAPPLDFSQSPPPTMIYVRPAPGQTFSFTISSATPGDVANPYAFAPASDFTFETCPESNYVNPDFCGPVAVGASTTW
jgi:hypothetical protein